MYNHHYLLVFYLKVCNDFSKYYMSGFISIKIIALRKKQNMFIF